MNDETTNDETTNDVETVDSVIDVTSALSTPGAHTVAIGDPENLFHYDVDSEGNVLHFRGANEQTKDATKTV